MSVRRSFSISMAEKYASIVIQLAGSMIVARLLSPAEFGIFSLAMSVSILAQVFRDLGIGQYLIQEKSLTQDKIRAAQAILMTASFSLGTLVILSADTAANFYQEPKIIPLLWMLGANFFLLPVGAVTFALWRRELQFGRIAIIAIVATLTNTLTTITLAYKGYSFLSLGWGTLAGSLITAALCVLYKPKNTHYLPGLRGIKGVLHYSSLATFNSLLETLTDRAPTLLLGKTTSMMEVGLYERALGIGEIFNKLVMQAIWSIAMPSFSESIRNKKDVTSAYLKSVSIIFCLGSTAYVFIAYNSSFIITFLFGDQWASAVPILILICIRKTIGLPNALAGSLLIAHGAIGEQTKYTLLVHGSFFIGVALGARHGAEVMMTVIIFTGFLSNIAALKIINKFISAKLILKTALLAATPALSLIGLLLLLEEFNHTESNRLIYSLSLTLTSLLLISYLTKSPLYDESKKLLPTLNQAIKNAHSQRENQKRNT